MPAPVQIQEGEECLDLLQCSHMVCQSSTAVDIFVAHIVDFPSPARGAQAIQNDAGNAQLCILLQAAEDFTAVGGFPGEGLGNIGNLHTAINVVDEGIGLALLHVGWAD